MLLTAAAYSAAAQAPESLERSSTRDRKIVRKWALPGDPRGLAIGADGTIYVGLAETQAIVAVDPAAGAIRKRVILDSAEIASTKELVTLRTSSDRQRLFVANGSDESVTILSLPELAVLREITLEGETIRDALPDPSGRYLYLLGRRVHIFDFDGKAELRSLDIKDPMAIATSNNGKLLAVFASEDYGSATATMVALFDTGNFAEVGRDPLQTEKSIEAAIFAGGDRSLVALARDALFEKPVASRPARAMVQEGTNGPMRMRIDFGDLVNSTHICLPEGSGPQIVTLAGSDTTVVYGERRCSAAGTFSGSSPSVVPVSLYGVNAYAIAWDRDANTLAATDRQGFLTIYSMPRPARAR